MFDRGEDARVLVRLLEDGSLDEQVLERQLQYRVERGTGVITSSLSAAAQEAGLSYNMVLKVAKVLGYDIDFAQDLRLGDSFAVIYEQVFRDGEHVRDGDVLAVSSSTAAAAWWRCGMSMPMERSNLRPGGRPLRRESCARRSTSPASARAFRSPGSTRY